MKIIPQIVNTRTHLKEIQMEMKNCTAQHPLLTNLEVAGISSVVRVLISRLKSQGFESLQERMENFLLQGQLSVPTLILGSVPPQSYCSNT